MIGELISPQGLKGMIDNALQMQLQADKTLQAWYRALIAQMFTDVIKTTPQWSGNLAENWYLEFNGVPKGSYVQSKRYGDTFKSGAYAMNMDPVVTEVINRELPKLAYLKYNTKVSFVNKAPYAAEVAAGKGPQGRSIRDVNLGPAGQVMMLTYVKMHYQTQGVTIG